MAIGLGRMFGFHFLENFNYPYISKSVTEFWRRWHISLSTWFRDYLYIPLGGNRRGNVYINLFIVFLATGTWHGVSITFIVWGFFHGTVLIIERILKQKNIGLESIPSLLRWVVTLFIVIIGWVIFRADSMSYAWGYLKVMFGVVDAGFKPYNAFHYLDWRLVFTFVVAVIASTNILPWIKAKLFLSADWCNSMPAVSYLITLVMFLICVVFIMNQGYSPFIYFRF
jgi:alginate O-acetyltransferase complex protein AlgI